MPASPDPDIVYGKRLPGSDASTIESALHPDARTAFEILRQKAAKEGIDLRIASGARDFGRQLSIWNRKAAGELPVLDDSGMRVDLSRLNPYEKVMAILRWSSLPGASRHHWGTDIDVYDASVLPAGYRLQLTGEEARGLFGRLHDWLDRQIAAHDACGFFRPYALERGGIAPEPWHLSYAPVARVFQEAFSRDALASQLLNADISLKDEILANLEEIERRFISVPLDAYPADKPGA